MALSKFNDFRAKLREICKREREEEDFLFLRRNKRVCKIENEMEYVIATVIAAGQLSTKQKQKQKSPDIIRDKTFWENGYQ